MWEYEIEYVTLSDVGTLTQYCFKRKTEGKKLKYDWEVVSIAPIEVRDRQIISVLVTWKYCNLL